MFTEGLDENAINWIKQGTGGDLEQVRSPLAERLVGNRGLDPPLYSARSLLSPKILPPAKFHSGLLGVNTLVGAGFDDEEEESVASAPDEDMDTGYSDSGEEELSSDADFCEKPSFRSCNEDSIYGVRKSVDINQQSVYRAKPTLVRGSSKENLRVELPTDARRFTDGGSLMEMHSAQSYRFYTPQGRLTDEVRTPSQADMGTPSAPPIMEIGREEDSLETEGEHWREAQKVTQTFSVPIMQRTYNESSGLDEQRESVGTSVNGDIQSQNSNQTTRCLPAEQQLPKWQVNLLDQPSYHNTSSQSAWQTLIAYDACFRLCLNAWARECLEAPEFLRDECIVLRNAFGLQKYLLQPRGQQNPMEAMATNMVEENSSKNARKVTSKIRVEVKKIRIIPRRRLRSTFSQRGSLYVQVGAEYVRHMSSVLKTRIGSLKLPSVGATSEEALSCLVQLKSSSEEMQMDPESAIRLRQGSGDSHIFYPESQADAILVEVKDSNRVTQGRAVIKLSSLADNPNDKLRWWAIYHEDQECVGKIQLSISTALTLHETTAIKSGTVVETLAYDLVLEAALRSEQFHSRNLRLHGSWRWLLTEFADYYGVTDAYTKLRYLSYVMDVATPTKDCLQFVYELLIPVVKARAEKNLTRQEKSILLECENQVEKLLASVFENYKSLDEASPSGLSDIFGLVHDSVAPALVPAVQIFTLLHDILSQEAQATLQNYLKTAAEKRCRRHMLETDEFLSGNNEGLVMDPMTISTAYLKMKTLCTNISNEIQADIKIHNQHILPSSIDLPNIATVVYSTELCNRLRCFLSACPPSSPLSYVTELLVATADFERDLQSWDIRPVQGGVDSKNLFNYYIMVWIEDKRLCLLEHCKADKAPWSGVTTHHSTSPFVEDMYDRMRDMLNEYEVVVNRWPQYALNLENAIASVERAVVKTMEKQFSEILAPLKDSIPKKLGIQVQKLTRRQPPSIYIVPNQLGTFLSTVKRILEVLHCRLEDILKPWASFMPVISDRKSAFGEQLNEVTVMLRTKYKNYMQATVEKLVSNTQANKSTRLKRILQETKEEDGQAHVCVRMQVLSSQIIDTIQNLHDVFSSRIFVAVCRGYWDKMGQVILSFLESRKENRVWFKGSYYALGVLDDIFASQMQKFQGNALQEKDLDPPRSVAEARSILCRDSPNTPDQSNYFYY